MLPIGQDLYMLQASSKVMGWGDIGEMKPVVFREANAFAESKGKVVVIASTHETPTGFGRHGSFELRFRLADKDSPEAKNVTLLPASSISVQKVETKDTTEKKRDVYTEILKLDDLRKRGLISDAEFEAQKKKLLEGN
jgi:hypothetical protein